MWCWFRIFFLFYRLLLLNLEYMCFTKNTSRIDLLHKTTFITTTSTNWYMFRVDDDRCQWYWSTGGIKNFHLSFSLFLNKFFTSHCDQKFRKCLSTFLDFLSQCTFIFLFLQSHTLIPLGLKDFFLNIFFILLFSFSIGIVQNCC